MMPAGSNDSFSRRWMIGAAMGPSPRPPTPRMTGATPAASATRNRSSSSGSAPSGSPNHTSPTPRSAVQSSRPVTRASIRDGATAASTTVAPAIAIGSNGTG